MNEVRRPSGRAPDELRDVRITRDYTASAEGSVLIEFGSTRVLCTASVEERVPGFLRGKGSGWVTAEYGMLPRSTNTRSSREAVRGKQGGRTMEIQRLIGRSMRSVIDLEKLGEHTITLDCDVIEADGGTRTASITGAWVAMVDALRWMQRQKIIAGDPLTGQAASVSAGIYRDMVVLDLDYAEDSKASTDMNFVMDASGNYIEVQGTAEEEPFSLDQLVQMGDYARRGVDQLLALQTAALNT